MKIKNDDLALTLVKLNSLSGLKIKGNIQLAVADLKNQITIKSSIVESAMKEVCESFCKKDEHGKSITESKQTSRGTFIEYKFDPASDNENKCKEEISKIGAEETEFTIRDSNVTEEYIGDLECTGDQTEALLMMIVKPTMVKA